MKYKPAKEPNDLERFFVERVNAGDVEGLVALYEPGALLIDGSDELAVGTKQIRKFFKKFLADRPRLEPSNQAKASSCGDLSLTSSKLNDGDITAEVARRQQDGNWLWVIDQFSLNKEK